SIIEALWGHDPPDSAAGTLQSYVSRLRRVLVPGGARGEAAKVLAWDSPGYKLVVGATALDAHRFESLADQGRGLLLAGDYESARGLLQEALALWRGPALLEFAHLDFAWGFASRLEERKLVATEDRIAADLRLGPHAAVVGGLGGGGGGGGGGGAPPPARAPAPSPGAGALPGGPAGGGPARPGRPPPHSA